MQPAEVFPLSEYLCDELAARGWSADSVSKRCNLPTADIQRILDGGFCYLSDAQQIGHALSVDPGTLLALQHIYLCRRAD